MVKRCRVPTYLGKFILWVKKLRKVGYLPFQNQKRPIFDQKWPKIAINRNRKWRKSVKMHHKWMISMSYDNNYPILVLWCDIHTFICRFWVKNGRFLDILGVKITVFSPFLAMQCLQGTHLVSNSSEYSRYYSKLIFIFNL